MTYNGKKWKLAFTAISLQIFWQNFYRNVPWVVLYKTYIFCCNLLIWIVTMATKRQNLRKNIQKSVWGIKLKLCKIVSNNSLYKNIVFFLLSLLKHFGCYGNLKVAIDLHEHVQWENWDWLLIYYLIADILTKVLQECLFWVVLHQAYHFRPNLSIWLVAMVTKMLNLGNNI